MRYGKSSDMICLDFYGLPGSGKSTISHIVSSKLRENENIKEVSYEIDHGYPTWIRGIIKLKNVISLLISNPSLFHQLILLIIKCDHSLLGRAFYSNLFNLAFKINAIQSGGANCLVFDHGFWQSVVSLHYRHKGIVDYSQTYKQLRSLVSPNIIFFNIYIRLEPEMAIKRMAERTTDKARLEYLRHKEKIQELNDEVLILNNYPKHDIIVDAMMSEDDCCDYIIDKLYDKGCFSKLPR